MYSVFFSHYSKNHYAKSFAKRHKKYWSNTLDSICSMLENLDGSAYIQKTALEYYIEKGLMAVLSDPSKEQLLLKLDFAVKGVEGTPHAQGNRCILVANTKNKKIEVLLLYSKTDLPMKGGETATIRRIVKTHFPTYGKEFLL